MYIHGFIFKEVVSNYLVLGFGTLGIHSWGKPIFLKFSQIIYINKLYLKKRHIV